MAVPTPFIKPIETEKGIFYTFQSAIDAITSTFNHDTSKFRFSKFALVNIPNMGAPETLETDNKVQFLAPGETPLIDGINSTNYNINLAESFQNYCLNLESLLLSLDDYDKDLRLTVSERVFWKWMKETGAIRFRRANTINERDSSVLTDERFVEEDDFDSTYDKVIKYMGEIDAINNRRGENSYSEVYIYTPTTVGTTPRVMFSSTADNNYQANMRIQNFADNPLNIEYLSGRNFDDVHPFGLSIKAFYDLDDKSVTTEISDDIDTPSYTEENWFTYNSVNAYYTDPVFEVADNQLIKKTLDAKEVNYIRNTLDGIVMDWNLENYKLANDNPEVGTFVQFSEMEGNDTKNFEYNAILVYYDIFDSPENPGEEESNVTTNLYGILFLSDVRDGGAGEDFYIPTLLKTKPDAINKTNGNSFAFKLNLKFDSSVNTAAVEKSINDYLTFSMDLYMDALNAMVNAESTLTDNINYITEVKNEIDELKDLFVNDANSDDITKRLDAIEESLLENQALFENTGTVMKLINDLYKKYNDIINDKTEIPINLALDPTTLNNLIVRNQQYNVSIGDYKGNILNDTTIKLLKYSNFFKHEHTSDITLGKDLVIKIDDTENKWQNGQIFRLTFDTAIDLDIFDLKIYTDATGTKTGTVYSSEILVTNKLDFITSDNKPIYEIVCVDSENYTFDVTKIR